MYINISDSTEITIKDGLLTIKDAIKGINVESNNKENKSISVGIQKPPINNVFEDNIDIINNITALHKAYQEAKIAYKSTENKGCTDNLINDNTYNNNVLELDEDLVMDSIYISTYNKSYTLNDLSENSPLIVLIQTCINRVYKKDKIADILNSNNLLSPSGIKWDADSVKAIMYSTHFFFYNLDDYIHGRYRIWLNTEVQNIINTHRNRGYTVSQIVEVLNNKNIRTPKGKTWTAYSLRNNIYMNRELFQRENIAYNEIKRMLMEGIKSIEYIAASLNEEDIRNKAGGIWNYYSVENTINSNKELQDIYDNTDISEELTCKANELFAN